MIHFFFALLLIQDPTPPPQQPPLPAPAPVQQEKPARSREDRLEGRIAPDPAAKPEPEAPAPETPAPKPAEDPMAGWTKFNAAALIVNEEPVTTFSLQRDVARSTRDRKGGNREAIFNEVIIHRAEELLEIQGGKDLGFDPEQVDRYVHQTMEHQTELAGSVTQLAADLKSEDMDSFQRRLEISDYVNKSLWEDSVTGKSPSPGGRVSRDTFVRPGFAMNVQRIAAREQPPGRMAQMTQLILTLGAPGGEERAKKKLEDLRQRIQEGEDMGELSEQFSASEKGTRGLTPFLPLEGLRASNPDVVTFLETAEVGQLSPVLNYYKDGKVVGYILVRAEGFKSATAPKVEPFDEPEGQHFWMDKLREQVKARRKQLALMELLSAAYVWPPQVFKVPDKPH